MRRRSDPFSDPHNAVDEAESGNLVVLARVLGVLFAAILSWILYRVLHGAWGEYQRHGPKTLWERRRGAAKYRRVFSGARVPLEGYRDYEEEEEEDESDEAEVDVLTARQPTEATESRTSPLGSGNGKGKAKGMQRVLEVEVIDEGYHDPETSFEDSRNGDAGVGSARGVPASPAASSTAGSQAGDRWKELPERPLPEKPLPKVPR